MPAENSSNKTILMKLCNHHVFTCMKYIPHSSDLQPSNKEGHLVFKTKDPRSYLYLPSKNIIYFIKNSACCYIFYYYTFKLYIKN